MGEALYGRPELNKDMGSRRFLEFYYLDSELTDFCKKNGLDFAGDRKELVERIASFLGGGKDGERFIPKNQAAEGEITADTPIEPDFVCNDKHREYFRNVIGSEFEMLEDFLLWLENNAGKTYGEAISIWYIMRDDLGLY